MNGIVTQSGGGGGDGACPDLIQKLVCECPGRGGFETRPCALRDYLIVSVLELPSYFSRY